MDYKKHYGLDEPPFRLTPDPDFFFSSATHQEALETLLYSIHSGEGFIQITGRPGTGKSMLLRKVLDQLKETVLIALILHSNIQADDLLYFIMQDLGVNVNHTGTPKRTHLISIFRNFLLKSIANGKQIIIIVDEAQNLPDETLEELRMLSNLETEKNKLLQIILVGQIELEEKISANRLCQLAQRITIRYRLQPLSKSETKSYILHRIDVASEKSGLSPIFFHPSVIKAVYKYSKGIPRLINIVCERSLMAAWVDETSKITMKHFKKALLSIEGERSYQDLGKTKKRVPALLLILLFTISIWSFINKPLLMKTLNAVKHNTMEMPIPAWNMLKTSGPPVTVIEKKRPVQHAEPPKSVKRTNETPPEPIENIKRPHETNPEPQKIVLENKKSFISESLLLQGDEGRVIVIDKDDHKLTSYHRQKGKIAQDKAFNFLWNYPAGVYMAGISGKGDHFLFNPSISYLMTVKIENKTFWNLIKSSSKNAVTPVIVFDDTKGFYNTNPGAENSGGSPYNGKTSAKEDLKSLKGCIQSWLNAWNAKDSERLMKHYANTQSIYNMSRTSPRIISKEKYFSKKEDSFNKISYLKVQISDLICLIDPLDAHKAYAVFHQTYKSETYNDRGTKVLYFHKLMSNDIDYDWKISGKLWVFDKK